MFLTDRFAWPSRAYPPTHLLAEPDGLFRDTWPGWSDSRLLPDKLIPSYVAQREERGAREARSRFAAFRLRFAGDRRVNQNVGQATYTGIVTFPFRPRDMPRPLHAERGSRERRCCSWLLINSYGNKGTSLYCQPASSPCHSFYRRLSLRAQRDAPRGKHFAALSSLFRLVDAEERAGLTVS